MEQKVCFNESQTLVVLPQKDLADLTASLEEIKRMIKDKAKEEISGEWLGSLETQKILGVSAKTWKRYRERKLIPFSQYGKKIYVKRADLEAFLQSHSIGGAR